MNKRFEWDNVNIAIKDNITKKKYYTDITCIDELIDLMNAFDEENTHLKKIINFDGLKYGDVTDLKLANEIIDSQREKLKILENLL